MDGFKPAFKILTYLGFWKPTSWTTPWLKLLYGCVRLLLVPLPYYLALGQILRLLLDTISIDEMTDTMFSMMSTVNVCCKITNLLLRKRQVAELMDMLRVEWTKPVNKEEDVIYNGCNDMIRYVTLIGFIVVEPTLLLGIIVPIASDKKQQALPAEVWTPYNHTSTSSVYWLSYAINSICAVSMGNLSIGTDVTIYGLMLATNAQLELLTHRLVNLSYYANTEKGITLTGPSRVRRENFLLGQSVRHHVFIYEFAERFVDTFTLSLLSQFIVSSTAVSVSIYQLTKDMSASSPAFYLMLFYLSGLMTQLFMFCWFGNEVTVRSQELGTTILEAGWTRLSSQSIKAILLISLRTSKPILISRGYFVTFSLETFKKILKVSYTAFNVLRDSTYEE